MNRKAVWGFIFGFLAAYLWLWYRNRGVTEAAE